MVSWSDPEVKANELFSVNEMDGIDARINDAKAALKVSEAEGSYGEAGIISSYPQERTLTDLCFKHE